MQEWGAGSPAATFDEVSMERSKSFVKALQELKNLRPQLYSAAEYCEKSYLHNEQKQMVLDNLKDYAVRALVNAVDHLGTVAYKLTDLFEQQTVDVSTLELKLSCVNQRVHTCQTYMDLEGLRQQQLSTSNPHHHKHYILPNFTNRKVLADIQLSTANQMHAVPRPHPPGTPASKTLFWHLASEDNSAINGTSSSTLRNGDSIAPKLTSETFHLVEQTGLPLPLSTHLQSGGRTPTTSIAVKSFGPRDLAEVSKPLSAYRSFDNPGRRDIIRPPARSKSMLASFFAKNKSIKQKKTYAT